MDITLNRKLNFVIPVDISTGVKYYVHSTPISFEVFETYFEVMGKAYTQIFAGGYGPVSGPKLAKMMVKKVAEQMGIWKNGPNGFVGVENGLFGEIRRLTNVIIPTEKGWSTIPFEDAIRMEKFDEEDLREIENAIAFFILASALTQKSTLRPNLAVFAGLWGAQLESLNCTEFAASLTTSTQEKSPISQQTELNLSSIPR